MGYENPEELTVRLEKMRTAITNLAEKYLRDA